MFPKGDVGFMVRVAVVDVGSNAIRLVWHEVSSLGEITNEGYHRYGLRLGTDAFGRGTLTKQTVQDLIAVFREVAALIKAHGIHKYRAVATAAMRAASNGPATVERIKRETGLELSIIKGEDESALSRQALVRAVGGVCSRTLLLDLGGGSLELERGDGRFRKSTSLGTVRLLARYPELSQPVGRTRLLALLRAIDQDLKFELGRRKNLLAAVGSGGNLDALSRICPAGDGPIPMIDLSRLPVKLVSIAAMTQAERVRLLGIRPDRADTIVPAGLVVAALHNHFGVGALMVPGSGIREALLDSQLDAQPSVEEQAAFFDQKVGVRKMRHHEKSLRHVFESLSPYHKLHGPGLTVLLQAKSIELAGLKSAHVEQAAADLGIVDKCAVKSIEFILGGNPEKNSQLRGRSQEHTRRTIRGLYQLAARLAESPKSEWPRLQVSQEVLKVLVPAQSSLMRWHFTAAAKTMGLGLLFAHAT